MSDKTYLGNNAKEVSVSPQLDTITKVIVNIDDENYVSYGTDTTGGARTLEVSIPLTTTTQALTIATALVNQFSSFKYQPYEADAAILNPAMELGDGVTTNGTYSGIYAQNMRFNHLLASDISAPQNAEQDHEYNYSSPSDRQITRKFSEVNSELEIKATQIAACVKKDSPTGQTSFSWELYDDHFAIKSSGSNVFYINASGAQFAGKVAANSIEAGTITVGGTTINAGYITGSQIGSSTILGSNIGAYTVAYGNAAFYGTLDQVGTNAANITALNGYFTGTVTATHIQAQRLSVAANGSFYFQGNSLSLRTLSQGGVFLGMASS